MSYIKRFVLSAFWLFSLPFILIETIIYYNPKYGNFLHELKINLEYEWEYFKNNGYQN